jgi:organic hydroperoxide reductase OsmC/OhrA
MAEYSAEILWHRGEQTFLDKRYSRRHVIQFDGGVEIMGSSSPQSVPLPMSDPSAVDPEELFISSLSSCHMLWFLIIAARNKFCVDRYSDSVSGVLEKNAHGKTWMSTVTLKPDVLFSGSNVPTREEIEKMHQEAHEECFIANSVRTDIRIEPVYGED